MIKYFGPHPKWMAEWEASADYWGVILSHSTGYAPRYFDWIGENLAFAKQGFDEVKFFRHLKQFVNFQPQNIFVACPDVKGNARQTFAYWQHYHPQIAKLGYKVAYVCQDGQEEIDYPSNLDAIFIGGNTLWKMSYRADKCIQWAKDRGLYVHVGRVNSEMRLRHFAKRNVDSVDGTNMLRDKRKSYERFDRILRSIRNGEGRVQGS